MLIIFHSLQVNCHCYKFSIVQYSIPIDISLKKASQVKNSISLTLNSNERPQTQSLYDKHFFNNHGTELYILTNAIRHCCDLEFTSKGSKVSTQPKFNLFISPTCLGDIFEPCILCYTPSVYAILFAYKYYTISSFKAFSIH